MLGGDAGAPAVDNAAMRWLPGLALAAGCYAPQPAAGGKCGPGDACPQGLACSLATHTCELDGTSPDAPPPPLDGRFDGPPGTFCYGTGLVNVCLPDMPTGVLSVPASMTLDTDAASTCTVVDAGACVIAYSTITIPPQVTLSAIGSRPLVLIGTTAIAVSGTLDLASKRASNTRGAGSNPAACLAVASNPSGGGAGGSFAGRGGDGGDGSTDGGSTALPPVIPTALRGGCDGRAAGSPGGRGGGAVFLISAGTITVTGRITASGAGGTGGVTIDRGGGGGGAGGMIGLDAPTITTNVQSAILANGGGGGKGGANGGSGESGDDALLSLSAAAGGHDGNTNGGNGGDGSFGSVASGEMGGRFAGAAGGGGGGGGAGVIRVFPPRLLPGAISPAPQ